MCAYADSSLAIGAEVKDVFRISKHQGTTWLTWWTLARIRSGRGNTGCGLRGLVWKMRSLPGNQCKRFEKVEDEAEQGNQAGIEADVWLEALTFWGILFRRTWT